MDEKNITKLKHTKILHILLFSMSIGMMLIYFNNFFFDYELFVQTLQYSAILLLIFIFIFISFNIGLVGGENKVKKVFDHLLFFGFLYYIGAYSISLMDKLSSGELYEFADGMQITPAELITNHLLITLFIPIVLMVTLIWSVRNIGVINKNESKNGNKNDGATPLYYCLVLLSLLGLIYSILTPLYSVY